MQLFTLKKRSKKHENIACAKLQVRYQIFMGPMAKTQLLKITKHYVIEFDKKTQKLTQSQTLSKNVFQIQVIK